jgi:hypothetical protein
MTRLMLSALAVCAILATATTMLRSHPHAPGPAAAMPVRDIHLAAGKTILPADHYEDMSLVYATPLPR